MSDHFVYNQSYQKVIRKKRRKSKAVFTTVILVAALVIAAGAYIVWQFMHRKGENESQVSQQTVTTNFDPYKTFTTKYFTFQTDKSWEAMPKESTANMFVYRAFDRKLTARDLYVYVDTMPPNLLLTYVLPVKVNGEGFDVLDLSEHCKKYAPKTYKSRNPLGMSYSKAGFTCRVDGTDSTVGTSVVGGSYQAEMKMKSGHKIKVFLLYHDLEFTPKRELFPKIVETFKIL